MEPHRVDVSWKPTKVQKREGRKEKRGKKEKRKIDFE